jgi:DNA-binding XRE family transcriptional regulator
VTAQGKGVKGGLEAAGKWVIEQRKALDFMSIERAAALAGVSRQTWRQLEKGVAVSDATRARASVVLGYTPQSIDLVIAGKRPVPADHPPAVERDVFTEIDELKNMVQQLLRQQEGEAPASGGPSRRRDGP